MHTKFANRWKAFWRGVFSVSPYAPPASGKMSGRHATINAEASMARHWQAVGGYLRDAMNDFNRELSPSCRPEPNVRTHSGSEPLPAVEVFAEYARISPDAPEQILRMAQTRQQAHFDKINEALYFQKLGQRVAAGVIFVALIVALGALFTGNTAVAVVAMAGVAVYTISQSLIRR